MPRLLLTHGLLFLFGLLLVPLRAQEQEQATQDVVILHDGQVIRGQIVARDTGRSLTLSLPGDSEWVIADSQIRRVEQQPVVYTSVRRQLNLKSGTLRFSGRGWYGSLVTGLQFPRITAEGLVPAEGANWGLYLRSGWRIRPLLGLGIAVGLQGLRGGTTAPLMLEASGGLVGRRHGPQYLLQAGWGAAIAPRFWINSALFGGPVAQAALGWRTYTPSRLGFSFLVGFRYQQTQEVEGAGWGWWGPPVVVNPNNRVTHHYRGLILMGGIDF